MTLIPSIIKKQSQDGSIDDGVVTILFWARSQTLRRRSGALFWSLFLGRRRTFREGKDFLYGTAATSTAREADLVVCCAFQCYYTELSSHYYSMLHFFFAFPQTFVAWEEPSPSLLLRLLLSESSDTKPTLKQNSVPKPVVQMSKVMIQTIYQYNKSKFLPFYFGFEAFESWF